MVSKFGPAFPCDPGWLMNLDRALKNILCFPLRMCYFVGLCGNNDDGFMEVKTDFDRK